MIGTKLSHFRIVAKLGEGGMGVVYRAEDERLRRPVALKVLPPELVSNEERRLRFLREARAAAAVTHPNIATVYDVGEADGQVFIAMELVEGRTLREAIGGKPMLLRDAMRVATEMAEGLARAHQGQVVHRDLKPDNVIVTSDGHAKILDFGLAKLLEKERRSEGAEMSRLETISGAMTREGKIFGTAAYMSPEQARGLTVDARSDLFSFGVVLYEMVTGRVPFEGKTATDTLSAIIRDQPLPPSQHNSEVPAKLEEFIAKCLEKDPAERYQHADEMAVDLRKLKRVTESGVQAIRTPSGRVSAVASQAGARPATSRLRLPATSAGKGILAAGISLAILGGAAWLLRSRLAGGEFRPGDRILIADFENETGRTDLDTAIRDIFEGRLVSSTFLEVVSGEWRKDLLSRRLGGGASKVGSEEAERACAEGGCAGYVVGRIAPEGSGYRLEVAAHRAGQSRPRISLAASAAGGDEIVRMVHDLALELRRRVGESPQSLSNTWPPTTRSVSALHLYVVAGQASNPVSLYQQALEIDPDFVDAWRSLAITYGDLEPDRDKYRKAAAEAYRRSAGLPDQVRLMAEIDYLDALYDYDTELDRLKAYQARFPFSIEAAAYIAWLYETVYQDWAALERASRICYQLSPDEAAIRYLVDSLGRQGKVEEAEKWIADFRARGRAERDVAALQARVHLLRGDMGKFEEAVALLRQQPGGIAGYGGLYALLGVLMSTGRWNEAERLLPDVNRVVEEAPQGGIRLSLTLNQIWLDARLRGIAARIPPEIVDRSRRALWSLKPLTPFCVEFHLEEPLAQVLQSLEAGERGSKSRFVREELQFARGGLALIRGRREEARALLEPLARGSILVHRHRMLGQAYEALGRWKEAAAEYEGYLHEPRPGWPLLRNHFTVLDQLRLAGIYERLGDRERAQRWYRLFLEGWKNADPDIAELVEAQERLEALSQPQGGAQ